MKKILFSLIAFSFISLNAQIKADFFEKADQFFQAHIQNGKVDYTSIKKNDSELNILVNTIASSKPSLSNKDEYTAFLINAYNLLVIKGIVDHLPTNSPLGVPGFFDQLKYNLGGEQYTLNQIEKDLLFKKGGNDARFHFVLVCGAIDCPPILNKAYLPSTINNQLEAQTTKALNNPSFIKVDGKKVKVSQIFNWYQNDFGDLKTYINEYRKEKLEAKTKISYYEYNWNLNIL